MAEFKAFLEGRWDCVPGVIQSNGPYVSGLTYLMKEKKMNKDISNTSSSNTNHSLLGTTQKELETAEECKARASQALCKSLQLGREVKALEERIAKQREEQAKQASILKDNLAEIDSRKVFLEKCGKSIEESAKKLQEIEVRIRECGDILDASAMARDEKLRLDVQQSFETFVDALRSFLTVKSWRERRRLSGKLILPLPQDTLTQGAVDSLGMLVKQLEISYK